MIAIRTAAATDLDVIRPLEHLDPDELAAVVDRGRVLLSASGTTVVGVLPRGLFRDEVPFMNLLKVDAACLGQGVGRRLVETWEATHREAGRDSALTSTLAHEDAQHFYRRRGYTDAGCLLLPGEAAELFLRHEL